MNKAFGYWRPDFILLVDEEISCDGLFQDF